MSSNLNPTYGQSVILTASVMGMYGTPTGTVEFFDNGSLIDTATLSLGVATFTTSAPAVGTQDIVAIYEGNSTHAGSTSSEVTETVAS
jgi:hypothetical protein